MTFQVPMPCNAMKYRTNTFTSLDESKVVAEMASLVVKPFSPRLSPKNTPRPFIHSSSNRVNCFLDLKPERHAPEPLRLDLPPWESGGPDPDVVVVGAGPAGLRLAEQVSRRGPSVCVVDPAPLSPWPNNYGSWVDEIAPLGLGHCLDHTWQSTAVTLDEARSRVLPRPYARLHRARLKSHLLDSCLSTGRVTFHRAKAARVLHDEFASRVACEDGVVVPGSLVVDASGFGPGEGYQIAYGILAEVESPHLLPTDRMVLMDWRDSHLRNHPGLRAENSRRPTFLYAMPFDENTVFLEETALVSRPAMGVEECRRRLAARAKHMGIRVKRVIEEERCVIPMGGPLPSMDGDATVAFGGAAGMVHPSTGYMVARSLAAAGRVADIINEGLGGSRMMRGAPLRRKVWMEGVWTPERVRSREFYRFGMETLLRLDLEGTRSFFEAFFELRPDEWEGFLASTLTLPQLVSLSVSLFARASPSSKLDILTKCPLPFASMLSNLALSN